MDASAGSEAGEKDESRAARTGRETASWDLSSGSDSRTLFPRSSELLERIREDLQQGMRNSARTARATDSKKAGEVELPNGFNLAGLLSNEPPGMAGLPFI